ncbi:RecQ family zinc-binding domain-containing protein [Enterococcus lactis]|nr:RecQ family zinc-binding domain-containing protein [Enterococcus lactis]
MGGTAQTSGKRKEFRLQQMLRYIHEEDCRRKFILAYFGKNFPKSRRIVVILMAQK